MRKLLFLEPLIALCAPLTYAQDGSRAEFFAGYSHENIDAGLNSSDFAGTGIPSTTLEQRNPIFLKSRSLESVTFPGRTAHGVRFSIGPGHHVVVSPNGKDSPLLS